tara:strand:- start:417 stop:1361 length:945 start_codon:yes stop_codon:yes gene_type:complete
MSIKEKLQSYPVPQLRILIKEHNKRVQVFIKDELKKVREQFKEEKLIKVTGIKDKDTIIDKMLVHEKHFKNVPMKVAISKEEQNQFLDKEMQPILNKIYKEYKADGDLDELEDGVSELYKLAKSKELKIFQSKKKMVNEIKKDVSDEKEKEAGRPPKPAKPPQFIFKDGKLVLVSLLEKRKQRPPKPTRSSEKIEGTHEMPSGEGLMTGDTHQENSKPVIVIDTKKQKKKPRLKIVEKKKEKPKPEPNSEDRAYNALLAKINKDKTYAKLMDDKLIYAKDGFFNQYKRFESMIKKRQRTIGQIEEDLAKTLKKK